MNELGTAKREVLKRLLALGASVRTIAEGVPCSTNTVKRYADMWALNVAACGCGKKAGHNGWCHVRLDFSVARSGFLMDRWQMRGRTELGAAVRAAAAASLEHGHQIGRFVYSSAYAGRTVAYALCQVCGISVSIHDVDSHWGPFGGTATKRRCLSDEEREAHSARIRATRKEKKAWQQGKRTLVDLRRMLRDPSRSRSAASTPAAISLR